MSKFLYKFYEERGEASLTVTDAEDNVIWEVKYPDYYEGENGQMEEGSTIFEDGFMKNSTDVAGLESYLKSLNVISADDTITDDESEMDSDEENDDEEIEDKYGKDVLEFTIPQHYVSALINADPSGLSDDDEVKLDKFVEKTVATYGNANFMLPNDEDFELGFKHSNDIDSLGSDCVMLLLRPSKEGFAAGGVFADGAIVDEALFSRFMKSEINHVISLKKVSEKKRAIKAWIDNMEEYTGSDIQKRIMTDNFKYALTQKKTSEINNVLKISLNALSEKTGSYKKGGTIDGHEVEIYETDEDVYDKYTVVVDGSVYGMSGGEGFNQYIGERSSFDYDISHWGKKVDPDTISEDFKNQIRARFEDALMEDGGTTGKLVVEISNGKLNITNTAGLSAAYLNITRKIVKDYIGVASAEETKAYVKSELEKRIHFAGDDASIENQNQALNYLTIDLISKALGRKGFFAHGGQTLNNVVFEAETKGGKWAYKIYQVGEDAYAVEGFKNGESNSFGGDYNRLATTVQMNIELDGSAKIDGINYIVKSNRGNFKVLPIDKNEPPLSRQQIFNKLGGEFASGGTIESRVKNRIKGAFELPLQTAIYVPSTKDKNVIISRKEMEKRVDEVEAFLSKLFGGFSAVTVEGGFESSDKGLVQENAVRVVAFAKVQDEGGENFESKFKELISHVKNWCKEWSQESIGVEFENDMFYVDADTKFEEGGAVAENTVKVFEKCRVVVKDEDMGGDTVYSGNHWINQKLFDTMKGTEIAKKVWDRLGADYGNSMIFSLKRTGVTKEKFENGSLVKEEFNLDSFLKHVYHDTKKLLNAHGLKIDEDYTVSDGGTKGYNPHVLVENIHTDKVTGNEVGLHYFDAREHFIGKIIYNISEMKMSIDFPEFQVTDEQSFDYELYEDGGQTERNQQIAQTILMQLGGANRLKMMTGAYNFVAHKNGVSFKIKSPIANYIKITLNSLDYYDMEIGKIRGDKYTVVYEQSNLPFDVLKPIIERQTGMYLSLAKGGINEPALDRVEKQLLDPFTAANNKGEYFAAIRYKGFLHDHKYFADRDDAIDWLEEYDVASLHTPENDALAKSKFKNLLSSNYASGGVVTFVKEDDKYSRSWGRKGLRDGKACIGAFDIKGWKGDYGYLYMLNDFDKEYWKDVPLKKNEMLFRYESEATKIGGYFLVIKINLEKGLLYFLEDMYSDDDRNLIFNSKGVKPLWISLHTDVYNEISKQPNYVMSENFKKGGNVASVEKKVAEVNRLIALAIDSDGDKIDVVDKSSTWEEPCSYSPVRYSNGVLYIEYYEPYSNKTHKEKILKRDMEFDGIPTLNNIAKQYRVALKSHGILFEDGGDIESGMFMEKGGVTGTPVTRSQVMQIAKENGFSHKYVLTDFLSTDSDAEVFDTPEYLYKNVRMFGDKQLRLWKKSHKISTVQMNEDGGVAQDELVEKIKAILDKELPNFYNRVRRYNIMGHDMIAIQMAASDYEINGVRGQNPQAVSLSLNPKTFELQPQIYGGNGGRSIYRKPNMDDPSEKYLAMKSVKIPFRTPNKDEKSVLGAIQRFAENYKKALKENIDVLVDYQYVDYKKLLS